MESFIWELGYCLVDVYTSVHNSSTVRVALSYNNGRNKGLCYLFLILHISVEKRELIIAHMKTNNIWDYMGMIYATLKKRL